MREDSKEQRRADDAARVKAWRALTTVQKIASLDARLGAGQGAKRQRKKLAS
jgi:hypothetical protein